MDDIRRFTAYKVSIGLLGLGKINLEKDKEDQTKERFNFLSLKDKEINRVNLIANIVDKFKSEGKPYAVLTLDDGTGQIRVKTFSDNIKMLEDFQPGDTILVIGTLRYFGNEMYILPEIIKKFDIKWLIARKLELKKEYGELYEESYKENERTETKETILQQQPHAMQPQTSQPQESQQHQEKNLEKNIELEKEINKQGFQESNQGNQDGNQNQKTQKLGQENQNQEQEKQIQEKQNEQRQENEHLEQTLNQAKQAEKARAEAQTPQAPRENLREKIIEMIRQSDDETGVGIDEMIMQLKDYEVEEIKKKITMLLEDGAIFEPRPGKLKIL